MASHTIAVAEDDGAIRDLVAHHLAREGFGVVTAGDGYAALRAARSTADLLVLDVGLSGVNGYEVARILRSEERTLPILMLTARTDEVDRIVGFELGADDYVCKPFSPRELVSRVKAILRRRGLESAPPRALLRFGRLAIDEDAREVRVDDSDIKVKPREFELLLLLARNPGIALSRERLVQRIWGFDFEGDERTVDVHVHRLRLRLERPWRLGYAIATVHRLGYKFVPP